MMQVLNNATIEERNHRTTQALNERLVLVLSEKVCKIFCSPSLLLG